MNLNAMIGGMTRWVEIESPTSSATAVNRMIDRVQADASDLPVATERTPGRDGYADILTLRSQPDNGAKGILILSHIDTVHPIGTLNGPLRIRQEGDRLYGPGVFDMKGGAYLAFAAFRNAVINKSAELPITFMFTPDEEVGSLTSRAPIEAEARRAAFVLVTEPARDGGKCVTARKGVGRFEVHAEGIPAHAGARHQDGRSAISELAHQVLAINAMTDYERGITTTVGMIHGGTAANVIPQHCHMSVDLRVRDAAAGDEMVSKILGLRSVDNDVRLTVTGGMNRPPYEKNAVNAALLKHAQEVARGIGIELDDAAMTGGGSDANFTAAMGVPTLDGLGIDGDGAHTEHEYALISSIEPRMRLMQGLLETLG
jgi:glutamate carboxypeptidase